MRLETVEIGHNRFVAEILRGNARINLSQMAKPFGKIKRPAQWLRTSEAIEYIEVVAKAQKCALADLVEVRKGGTPELAGTWCNDYHIALRFAQWLSPEFSYQLDTVLIRLMFGDAVFAEPINGVEPLVQGGKLWYNYRDALESFGRSRRSSASRRKHALPQCFRTIYGRNFITRDYFLSLKAYYDWKAQYRQLELDFNPEA